jgi:hypothetical protein
MAQRHLKRIADGFLAHAFKDKDIGTHEELWDAVLTLTKQYPLTWDNLSDKKPLSSLITFIANAGYGSGPITFPSLLPLLAHLPASVNIKCLNGADVIGCGKTKWIPQGLF